MHRSFHLYTVISLLPGEHNEWCKTTVLEESLQAPAMVRIPGLTDEGIVTQKLTEFVDIFPTVIEASGFEPGLYSFYLH